MHAAAEQDGVVGAAHGDEEIRGRRAERCRAHAVDDMRHWKTQEMRLVQGHFQHPRHHLNRTGQAGGRGEDQGQLLRRHAALIGDLVEQRDGRDLAGFQHQASGFGLIPVAQFLEQRFLAGQGAAGAGAQGEKSFLAFAMRQTPAGVLATQAGQHRLGRRYGELPGPAGKTARWAEGDLAKAAQADLGDAPACLDPARHLDSGVDDAGAVGLARNGQAQCLRLLHQLLHQRSGELVETGRGRGGVQGHGASVPPGGGKDG